MFPIIYKFIDDKIKNVYNKGRCKKLADNSIQKESTGYEKKWIRLIAAAVGSFLLAGCGADTQIDDYATNAGAESLQQTAGTESAATTTATEGIPKDEIKVGVLHLSDPAEGSGYTYTHDLGIQGMQQNLGLSDDQIVRKSMSQIPMRMRQSRRFRNVSTRAVTLSLRPAGVTWSRQRRWRRNIRIFIFPMEPVI